MYGYIIVIILIIDDKNVTYVLLGATIGCMFYSLIFFASMLLIQFKKSKVVSVPRISASFV